MKRRVIAILVAGLLAVVGAALVLIYVSRADERAIADQQPTDVYVALKEIPSGTTLKDAERKELLELTQVPATAVPTGALGRIDADNNQLLAQTDIAPGEILLDARFGATPRGTKAIEVPAGMLAVAVELTDPQRVGQFVTPGSRITIYRNTKMVSLGDSDRDQAINDNDFFNTEVLLGDVQVIGMGNTALSAPVAPSSQEDPEAASAEPGFLVTVAVTPQQSLRLVHQAMTGEMYAALRGSDVDVDVRDSVNDLEWPGGIQ